MAWTAPRTWVAGELVTDTIMNTHVRDNELAIGPHLIVRKSSDQSVTSSTVQVSDSALVLPVGVSEVWRFEFGLIVDTGPGGMDVGFTFPSGGYFSGNAFATGTTGTQLGRATGTSPVADAALGIQTAGDRYPVDFIGVYVNGGTGGNLQLTFAQTSSNGTPCIMKANSTLWAVKLA
jgi:hypothetical protein